MPDSVETITQNIINQIRATDPAFSFQVVAPERKIIEAVATQIAQAQIDFSVLDTQGNIDTMTGRWTPTSTCLVSPASWLPRQRAPSRSADRHRLRPISQSRSVPRSRLRTLTRTRRTYLTTTETVVLHTGDTSVDAPVIASTPGSIGNVAAGTVNGFATLTGIPGITGVTMRC